MNINLSRLKKNMIELAGIGCEKDGGITRISYSSAYEEAANYVALRMRELGLEVWRDAIGNLFGRWKGEGTKCILLGSHIDTVPHGGMFDGSLGVMGAIEVLNTLIESKYIPQHSIVIAAFVDEEGGAVLGTLGSKSFSGQDFLEFVDVNKLHTVGKKCNDIDDSKANVDDLNYYLELHIEQGGILEQRKIPIGVVEGIVGIIRYDVKVIGKANHAGSTPMGMRDDALRKALEIIGYLYEKVEYIGGELVATVGQITVRPGAPNVIPGEVYFTIELRDMCTEKMETVISDVIEYSEGKNAVFERTMKEPSVHMASNVIKAIQKASTARKYSWIPMVSGAGHDAIPIGQVTQAGMIFIPSIGGISHSKYEKSNWDDVEKGANVMLSAIMDLDIA